MRNSIKKTFNSVKAVEGAQPNMTCNAYFSPTIVDLTHGKVNSTPPKSILFSEYCCLWETPVSAVSEESHQTQ